MKRKKKPINIAVTVAVTALAILIAWGLDVGLGVTHLFLFGLTILVSFLVDSVPANVANIPFYLQSLWYMLCVSMAWVVIDGGRAGISTPPQNESDRDGAYWVCTPAPDKSFYRWVHWVGTCFVNCWRHATWISKGIVVIVLALIVACVVCPIYLP